MKEADRGDHARSAANASMENVAFTLFFLAVAFWKSPVVFAHPRFWAEEGSVFYARFLHSSFLDSIFFVKSGSLQLLTNAIVYAAAQVPIELAPTVTTYGALLLHVVVAVQIAVFALVQGLSRMVGLLLVGAWALLPQTYEVWLTATNAQWVAGVSVLMLFAMPTDWIARHWRGAALWCFVCGLSGVPATLLAPMFGLRSMIERSLPIAVLTLALAVTAIIQITILATTGEHRPYLLEPLTLSVPLFLQSVLAPLISVESADRLAVGVLSGVWTTTAISLIATATLALAVMSFATAAAGAARKTPAAWLVLLTLVSVTILQNFGGLEPRVTVSGYAGGRYFLCGSMCLCLLLCWGTLARLTLYRGASFVLLCTILLVGAITAEKSAWTVGFTHGPSWRDQIKHCAEQQTCKVTVWPGGTGWTFEFKK